MNGESLGTKILDWLMAKDMYVLAWPPNSQFILPSKADALFHPPDTPLCIMPMPMPMPRLDDAMHRPRQVMSIDCSHHHWRAALVPPLSCTIQRLVRSSLYSSRWPAAEQRYNARWSMACRPTSSSTRSGRAMPLTTLGVFAGDIVPIDTFVECGTPRGVASP
eukprot:scaffold13824_cov147-Skeletonema_dohrnii-CCMP3373.AAC.4